MLTCLGLIACTAKAATRPHIRTRDELAAYFRSCAYACESNPSFTYDASLSAKIKDKEWLSAVFWENGISSASWSHGTQSVTLTKVTYYEEFYHQDQTPIYWFSSPSELSGFFKSMALERKTAYTFFYDASLGFSEHPAKLQSLVLPAGAMSYNRSIGPCRVHISNAVYPDVFAFCETESDVRKSMEGYAQSGVCAYSLFCEPALYEALSKNNFSKLYGLEAEARIQDRTMRYSDESGQFIYEDIVYAHGAQQCTTLSQVSEALCQAAGQLQTEVTLFCSPEIYRRLTENERALLRTLADQANITTYQTTRWESKHIITVHDIAYRPGFKLLTAYRIDRWSLLTSREQAALSRAIDILNNRERPSDYLGTEKWIHDYLCQTIVYTIDDNTDEDDNAIGALLNGEANCDGYADAFYLLGNLIGLEVGYQTGTALGAQTSSHAWNTICIQNRWYLVDVTWDDDDNAGDFGYTWYNVGADIAGPSYQWDETWSGYSLAAATQNAYRPRPLYQVRSLQELTDAIAACRRNGNHDVDIFYSGEDLSRRTDAMFEAVRAGGATGTIYSRMYRENNAVSFTDLQFK